MYVIQKSMASYRKEGKTVDKVYGNVSFYVQDLKRDGGRSKAKTYILWYSAASAMDKCYGVTRFETERDAQEIIDHYPNAFGKGCKPVDESVPGEIARKQAEFWKSRGL